MQFEFWNTNILLLPICVYIYLFGDVPSYFSTTEIMVIFTFYRAITVGRKAFLFFCFLCMRKTFFYATKSCFLLIQLFCMCSLKTNPVFLQSKPFFYMMHRMSYFGLDTWHLLFDKLSHNDKPVSFFCNSFDSFPKFNLSIH